MKEDGSEPVCLAKVHPGAIQVDGDVIYFENLSDHKAIYRIGTDGSHMEKLNEGTNSHMQMSEEYIYFCAAYDEAYDCNGLVTESRKKEGNFYANYCLYRMKKDGSGKELLTINAYNYMLCDGNSGKVRYKGDLYCGRREWNEETGQGETIVTRYDLDGQKGEEICRFDFYGEVIVYGDRIYCHGTYGEDEDRISMYTIRNREMISLPDMKLEDCCVYKGSLYGLSEQVDGGERFTKVYMLAYDWSEGDSEWQMIYSNSAECTASGGDYNGGMLADLYATGQGVFLRQFVSSEAGVRWFSIGENGTVKKWEDEKQIPIAPSASMLEYTGEWLSIKSEFESTEGYEEYLKEDLVYEAFYERDEEGEGRNPYRICLPQFQEKIAGYRKINAYFQNAFQEALADEEAFFDMLDEEKNKDGYYVSWCESTLYDYIYVGDEYITVAMFKTGYRGGIRNWDLEEPVTFDRQTGEVVTLEELFGVPLEEAVAMATGSVYKYMECVGRGSGGFFLQSEDILTQEYDPGQFFLFPEGIGIYYQRYAIDCGAAGDYLFIVPFQEGYCVIEFIAQKGRTYGNLGIGDITQEMLENWDAAADWIGPA